MPSEVYGYIKIIGHYKSSNGGNSIDNNINNINTNNISNGDNSVNKIEPIVSNKDEVAMAV